MTKLIVAYDPNMLIGKGDKLPWHIEADLDHFKKETINKTIIMGQPTFEGIGKPLPNRKTVILTKDLGYKYNHPDVQVINSIDIILRMFKDKKKNVIVAGGATIYKLFIPYVDELVITHIKKEYEGDVYFPKWNPKDFIVYETKDYPEFTIKKYLRRK